jgi:hypothetical protein
MESLSTIPPVPHLSMDGTNCFDATTVSAEIIRGNKGMTDSVPTQATKEAPSKKKRNAGERIQRRQ